MKKLLILLVVLFATSVQAADVNLRWDVSPDATGYKVYMSIDNGRSWDGGLDVGNVTAYTYQNVPDNGLILFKGSAYNANGEAVRSWSGAWYNGDWKPPTPQGGIGIQ